MKLDSHLEMLVVVCRLECNDSCIKKKKMERIMIMEGGSAGNL